MSDRSIIFADKSYAKENHLIWLGCGENDDECLFLHKANANNFEHMFSMWYIESEDKMADFHEYCRKEEKNARR